jgi:hypothetical protein
MEDEVMIAIPGSLKAQLMDSLHKNLLDRYPAFKQRAPELLWRRWPGGWGIVPQLIQGREPVPFPVASRYNVVVLTLQESLPSLLKGWKHSMTYGGAAPSLDGCLRTIYLRASYRPMPDWEIEECLQPYRFHVRTMNHYAAPGSVEHASFVSLMLANMWRLDS